MRPLQEPIKAGDLATIVEGALGNTGPNIGKTVRVESFQGDNSVYGRIWRVSGEGLVSEFGAAGGRIDCAQAWLKKIEPPPVVPEVRVIENEMV